MSLWDSIWNAIKSSYSDTDAGTAATVTGGFGGGAAPGGTRSLNDAIADNEVLAQSGLGPASTYAKGVSALGTVQRAAYTVGVSRPLTTGMLLLDNEDPSGSSLNPIEAWNQSRFVSPGQAIVAGFNRGRLGALGDQGAESPRNQVNRAIVNQDRLDASDVGGAFKNNPWANLVSGGSDFTFQVALDPLSRGLQGAGVWREANLTRTLTEKNVGKLRAEVTSGQGGLATAIREMPESFEGVMASPLVRQSADPEAMGRAMYLAGKVAKESADEAETAVSLRSKVVLAATGDQNAIDELRQTRALLADQLDTLTGVTPKDVTPDLFDDLVLRDRWLAAALGEADNAGAVGALVNRPTAAKFSVWEANKARRAESLGRLRVGDDAAYFAERKFQLAPGARTVRTLHWMGQTKPKGMVQVSGLGMDGYTDIQSAALRVKSWTPEARAYWGERWAEASTTSQRSLVAADFRRASVRAVVEEHGMTGKMADDFTDALIGKQGKAVDDFRSNGYLVDGDEIVHDAMLKTQLRDSVPLIDLDYLYKVMPDTAAMVKNRSAAASARRATGKAFGTVVEEINGAIDAVWRPLVLLRGGYMPRNTGEAWGRMAGQGVLGRIAAEQGAEGVANWFRNRAAGVNAMAVKAGKGVDSAEFGAVRRRVADKAMVGKGTLDLPGGLTANDAFRGAGAELIEEGSSARTVRASLKPGEAMGGAQPIIRNGTDVNGVTPGLTTGSWSEFRLDPPQLRDVGLDDVADVLPDTAVTTATKTRTASTWDDYNPDDVTKYFDGYTRVVNKQLLGDPIAKQVLKGRSRDEIKAWVARRDQYGLRREYGLTKAEARDRVDTIANYVDELVPDELRGEILAKEGLSPQEYKAALEGFELGPIHVQNIESALIGKSSSTADRLKKYKAGLFQFIGSMPEDTLVRNPYMRDVYRRTMETRARVALADGVEVTDDMILGWERQARKAALQDVKNYIYTIERYSNAADSLRIVSPFIAATNNTVRTWGKIIGKNPQVIGRANQLWNSPLRAGLVVQTDEEGGYRRVNSNSPGIGLSSAYGMVIPVPKKIKDAFGVPEQFTLVPPLASMNVALQSDPIWLPGWGPMVTVPFGWYANKEPTNWFVERFGGYIFPRNGDTGNMQSPPEPWKAALPAYIRQAFNREDPDGSQRTSIFATIAADEFRKAYESGDYSFFDSDGRWVQEIEKQTDAYFALRVWGSGTLPFAANLQDPEAQFYIAQFREYQREGEVGGVSATERFIRDYGEAFRGYTFSATRNNTGANADVRVQRRIDGLDPALRDTLGALNPQLIGALVNNPDGSYDFSSPVLNRQKAENTGPTANLAFREPLTGAEAFNRTQVSAGWDEYIASRRTLDAWMRQNNVRSLSSVPNMQAAWSAYVADLQASNPAWAQEYTQRDDGKFTDNARGFELMLEQRPDIAQRPEMALVQDYLASRNTLSQFLSSGQAPAKTLTAKANEPLRAAWDAYVRDLLNRDERFADLYFQFFDGEFARVEDQTTEGF